MEISPLGVLCLWLVAATMQSASGSRLYNRLFKTHSDDPKEAGGQRLSASKLDGQRGSPSGQQAVSSLPVQSSGAMDGLGDASPASVVVEPLLSFKDAEGVIPPPPQSEGTGRARSMSALLRQEDLQWIFSLEAEAQPKPPVVLAEALRLNLALGAVLALKQNLPADIDSIALGILSICEHVLVRHARIRSLCSPESALGQFQDYFAPFLDAIARMMGEIAESKEASPAVSSAFTLALRNRQAAIVELPAFDYVYERLMHLICEAVLLELYRNLLAERDREASLHFLKQTLSHQARRRNNLKIHGVVQDRRAFEIISLHEKFKSDMHRYNLNMLKAKKHSPPVDRNGEECEDCSS